MRELFYANFDLANNLATERQIRDKVSPPGGFSWELKLIHAEVGN